MKVAAFSDVHARADGLRAVLAAAVDAGVDELWSLGDLVGGGPDPVEVVRMVRAWCRVALAGNHDYGATGSVDASRFGEAGHRSVVRHAEMLAPGDREWLRRRRPAARRAGVQCWHASPRDPVREYVGAANAGACLQRQRERLGLIGHTHAPAAWRAGAGGSAERVRIEPDRPLALGDEARWLLNPGAVGAPAPPVRDPEAAMAEHARAGAWWLELDLGARVATWRRAPFAAEV